jgi:PIN domain nuclease of toxin-antitoxin system
MRVLLDTQAWLWFALGDGRLRANARRIVEDPVNDKFVSPASYWELAIKIGAGKYALTEPYLTFVERATAGNGFHILPIEPSHTALLTSLPHHHRDPFDRLPFFCPAFFCPGLAAARRSRNCSCLNRRARRSAA